MCKVIPFDRKHREMDVRRVSNRWANQMTGEIPFVQVKSSVILLSNNLSWFLSTGSYRNASVHTVWINFVVVRLYVYIQSSVHPSLAMGFLLCCCDIGSEQNAPKQDTWVSTASAGLDTLPGAPTKQQGCVLPIPEKFCLPRTAVSAPSPGPCVGPAWLWKPLGSACGCLCGTSPAVGAAGVCLCPQCQSWHQPGLPKPQYPWGSWWCNGDPASEVPVSVQDWYQAAPSPVLGTQQMNADVAAEADSGVLSKLLRYLCYFLTVDSTDRCAPCHCCMTFRLAQGLFLARDYQKYFSVGLSLLLNKESYYCKNFAGTKKIYWTNGKL